MLRSARAVYLASTAFLLFGASVGAQSRSAPRPCGDSVKAGTFRLVVTSEKGAVTEALLVLERVEGCLEATFIADGVPASNMRLVSVVDGVVTGQLRMTDGVATATMRLTDNGINGDIARGKSLWRVTGKRTA